MNKKVLILCNANPDTNPRPNRMIHYLKDKYQVTVVGQNQVCIEGVKSIGFLHPSKVSREGEKPFDGTAGESPMKWSTRLVRLPNNALKKLRRIARLAFKRYEDIVWSDLAGARAVQGRLAVQDYALVISHDISLLPLAFNIAAGKKTKVMLDAKEFYPRNFDDQWQWRLQEKPVNEYLCKKYLPRCDKIITVSNGLAREYKRTYNVDPEVFMSLPPLRSLSPVLRDRDQIRMIYHGYASPSRRTEVMIKLMDYLDERFSLDLMLLETGDRYYEKIVSMAKSRPNVKVIPPVPMQEIIPFTNQYDIGLFLCPPTNFNLTYTLPNKFFEFIQARLAIAIGPSVEMKEIVEKYDCGIVSQDFSPASLAEKLNALTHEQLIEYKRRSDIAAYELNAAANQKKILDIVQTLIGK